MLVQSELQISADAFRKSFQNSEPLLSPLGGLNIMLFNPGLLNEKSEMKETVRLIKTVHENLFFSLLINFRNNNYQDQLSESTELGIRCVKFHPYVQEIDENDFSKCLEAADFAESKGLAVCIDTSFGGPNMYQYDNLRLAAEISKNIKSTPIVLLHSGGARVKEAFLLAASCENVFLETSFSLNYWKGSSFEDDLGFAIEKLGSSKVIYGSDFPYVGISESLETHRHFFKKIKLNSQEIENICFNNVFNLFFK